MTKSSVRPSCNSACKMRQCPGMVVAAHPQPPTLRRRLVTRSHAMRATFADVSNDLRYAARMLRHSPSFASIAILTLALGVGANTAMFSVVNAVLLRPLPYDDPDRLAMLWTDDPKHDVREEGTSYPTFLDWRSQSRTFADFAICSRGNPVTLTGGEDPERVLSEAVSANLFPLLGVTPILGRTFSHDEEERRERVVVLSHAF